MPDRPLCFVLMPFGKKADPAGGPEINFDTIYLRALAPAIEAAGLSPIRADEEKLGGVIHQAMFERLLLCDYAVADLTTANPNVLYELGVRHAARPRTTLTVYAYRKPLPFDVGLLRTQGYKLTARNTLSEAEARALRRGVETHLRELRRMARRQDTTDSPLFQLISAWRPEQLPATSAKTFAKQVRACEELKRRLQDIRRAAVAHDAEDDARAELAAIDAGLRDDDGADPGVFTEVMLAYRALDDWSGMIDVYEALPEHLSRQITVRQLVAFAHNRRAEDRDNPRRDRDRNAAIRLLREIEKEQGPTSETYGLLGRVYKSHWAEAFAAGDDAKADGLLKRALTAYLRGFEIDLRDYYPGINALTLLDVQGTAEALATKSRLLPVVRFALDHSAVADSTGYWVLATRLELAVLDDETHEARDVLGDALALEPEHWQRETTANNLRLIRRARAQRGVDVTVLDTIIRALDP